MSQIDESRHIQVSHVAHRRVTICRTHHNFLSLRTQPPTTRLNESRHISMSHVAYRSQHTAPAQTVRVHAHIRLQHMLMSQSHTNKSRRM